ncbi:hypothetical protein [Photobacterium leiognathi]|uniref:hypothetical protein n=1 Tax=Photobacterium leiognathi TaxID=553611 RepID=UPI002734E84B|nr:hypothetical protein [Photobacterium leiognathi]
MMIKLPKGLEMEELIRSYLLNAGYYVIRGVPYEYQGSDVTDIDLWLYSRASVLSREISIIDVKNKKTPQALERIFWVRGLQEAIGADRALIATTDRRDEVKSFGKRLDVTVLDGEFLSKLSKSHKDTERRYSEEELVALINKYEYQKIDGQWQYRLNKCKSLVIEGLNFSSAIQWLSHAKFFAEQVITKSSHQEISSRCFYLLCSYIALGVDYMLKECSFLSIEERKRVLTEGFTYGDGGINNLQQTLNITSDLIKTYIDNSTSINNQIQHSVYKEIEHLEASSLGDFFSRVDVGKKLFTVAIELEASAMARNFKPQLDLTIETRAFLGCLLDYLGINRKEFNAFQANLNQPIQGDLPI